MDGCTQPRLRRAWSACGLLGLVHLTSLLESGLTLNRITHGVTFPVRLARLLGRDEPISGSAPAIGKSLSLSTCTSLGSAPGIPSFHVHDSILACKVVHVTLG